MKRVLSVAVLLAVAVCLWAGGEEETGGSLEDSRITLGVISGVSFAEMVRMVPAFETETGIEVEVVETPFLEFFPKLLVGLQSGSSLFDVFNFHHPMFAQLVSGNYLEPLDSYFENPELAFPDYDLQDHIPLNWVTSDGSLYGVPFDGGTVVVFYRKDLFDQNGLTAIKPTLTPDWVQQYSEYAQILTKDDDGDGTPEFWGTTLPGRRSPILVTEFGYLLKAFGGDWFDEEWQPTFHETPGVNAFEFLHDQLYELRVASPASLEQAMAENVQFFLSGNAAMVTSHNWPLAVADDPEQSQVVGKWDIMPRPASTVNAQWFWGVASDSREKNAAFMWAQWTTTKERLRGLAEKAIPVTRSSVMTDPGILADNPAFEIVAQTAALADSDPKLPEWEEVRQIVMRVISDGLSDASDLDAERMLADAAVEVEALLRERGYY